ncbi:hypothetical protein N0V90_012245 [Kalmusia sp. IMI 367209]|nr:hypothetical protein N0V90_012245 [Kalmusia sp. IMI 367209]
MHAHESILRTECNYTGTQPYWDEPLDAGNFSHSVVLDSLTGFGGDGTGPNNCIADGPFKDYVNALGPFQQISDHCIDRRLDECSSAMADKKFVNDCMAMKNFTTFWPCLEGGPHGAGHGGIGGQLWRISWRSLFPAPPSSGTGASSMGPVKRDGDPGEVTTLGHVLTLFGLVPNVTIADVMDVQGGLLCYEYV